MLQSFFLPILLPEEGAKEESPCNQSLWLNLFYDMTFINDFSTILHFEDICSYLFLRFLMRG